MVVQQKLLEKAYFIIKPTGRAMVRPASSDKWKAPLVCASALQPDRKPRKALLQFNLLVVPSVLDKLSLPSLLRYR